MRHKAKLTRCTCGMWSYSQPCGVCRAEVPDWQERKAQADRGWWPSAAELARQQAEQDLADWLAQDVH